MKKSLSSILSDRKRDSYQKVIFKALHSLILCILLLVSSCRTVDSSIADLKNGDYFQRRAAVEFLANSSDPRVVELLIAEMTNAKFKYIREEAAEALVKIGQPAVAPLIAALNDNDSDVRDAVIKALGKIGIGKLLPAQQVKYYIYAGNPDEAAKIGQPAVEPSIAILNDEDSDVRPRAAYALGKIGDSRAVEPLIAMLNDEDSNVRDRAAYALGKIGDSRAVEPLIAMLNDEDSNVRDRAAYALGEIGDSRAVEPLIAMLNDEDSNVRTTAAYALGKIGDSRAIEPFIAMLSDEDSDVRDRAAYALGEIGDSRAVEPLIAMLNDEDSDVRDRAAYALIKIGQPSVGPLIATLNDDDMHVRYSAADALVKIGQPVVEPLIAMLNDEDSNVRTTAAYALGKIGDSRAIESLTAALNDEDSDVRWKAAEALRKIGDSRAVEPFIAALDDENTDVRKEAAKALVNIGDSRATELLIAALDDKDSHVRWKVAEALGNIGDSRAVESLIAILNDEKIYVREEAAKALGNIGDSRAAEPLIAALKYHDSNILRALKYPYSNVREAVVEALGKIGDSRAIESLIAALNDEDSDVRWKASQALGKIGIDKLLPTQQAKYYVYTRNAVEAAKIGRAAVEPLIAAMNDYNSDVREAAAKALGNIGDYRAVEPLIAILNDEKIYVREEATEALVKIGQPAVALLIAALNDNGSKVRDAVVQALGRIGIDKLLPAQQAIYYIYVGNPDEAAKIGQPAVKPLVAALGDEAFGVRCYASEALSDIGQPSVESLIERLSAETNDTWTRIALTLCGHQESADIVLQNLEQGSYTADMRCLLLGWFGSVDMLPQLEQLSSGSQLRKAARYQQLNDDDWTEVVQKCVIDTSRVETALSALSIIEMSSKRQFLVEDLCLRYIRRGDIRIIPQLIELLNKYGTVQLAEDYLNCGQKDLNNAAVGWARAHGYSIRTGYGSARARWGSDR